MEPEAAFTALWARMYEKLRGYAAIELNDPDAAADTVQSVFAVT